MFAVRFVELDFQIRRAAAFIICFPNDTLLRVDVDGMPIGCDLNSKGLIGHSWNESFDVLSDVCT
ncbi:hypothetical protein D918_09033 [Trichuris suis]|nr:hypothetical protein D918_09033 [Trichuris suis]